MTNLYINLLLNDKPQAMAADIGIIIKPKPVTDKVDVAPIITILFTVFEIVSGVL